MLNRIGLVFRFSWRNIVKSKILALTLWIGFGICLLTWLTSQMAVGNLHKISIDIGLGLVTISSLYLAILTGIESLSKEIKNRTLYIPLVSEVSRAEYILGKVLALACLIFFNTGILFSMCMVIYALLGGSFSYYFFFAFIFIFLESFVLGLFTMLFSLFLSIPFSIILSFVTYVCGHGLSSSTEYFVNTGNTLGVYFTRALGIIVPNLSLFNLKDHILYESKIAEIDLSFASMYGILFSCMLVFLIVFVFRGKELN